MFAAAIASANNDLSVLVALLYPGENVIFVLVKAAFKLVKGVIES
jgi:hypothetical protein